MTAARPPRSAFFVPVFFILFAIAMAVLSQGFFEPFDEVVHFLYASKAWTDPSALLSIWARAGCTGLYALTAPLGLMPTRLLAAGVTAMVGFGTVFVGEHFVGRVPGEGGFFRRHREAFLWLLLFAQPCFAMNSFTIMTEMPLACAWVWAAAALVDNARRPVRGVLLASLCMGLGGLMRPEGWVAIFCWPAFVVLWLQMHDVRKGRAAAAAAAATVLAALPALGWYVAGALYYHNWGWVVEYWPWAAASPYGKTGLIFLVSSTVALGLWMWPAAWVGAAGFFRGGTVEGLARREGVLLLVVPFFGFFLMHGVLGSFGLFGSMSLPRYFVAVAPLAAILTLVGLMRLEFRWPRWKAALRWVAIGGPALTLGALVVSGHLPSGKNLTTRRFDVAIASIRERVAAADYQDMVIAGHPYVLYALGMPVDERGDIRGYSAGEIRHAAAGTLLLMDDDLWTTERRPPAEELKAWGYREDMDVFRATSVVGGALRHIRTAGEVAEVHLWVKER